MASNAELIALNAREAVALLRAGKVSPVEMVDAAAERIAEVDGAVNALPILCLDKARAQAKSLKTPDDPGPGWLAGLPVVIKDLNEVAGVRTTFGSPVFADHVPDADEISVSHLRRSGAVFLGKSNTPEFGAGANTFNEVFGKTLNPWNTALTCGGSSGGSAVALATGMAWLATGSDLGGSLRTPASFCSVVGLRPSPGRVAHGPGRNPFQMLSVDGPMGRTVGDVALMLDAEAGRHRRDPISLEAPAASFQDAADAPRAPLRPDAAAIDDGYSARSIAKWPISAPPRRPGSPRPAPSSRKRRPIATTSSIFFRSCGRRCSPAFGRPCSNSTAIS